MDKTTDPTFYYKTKTSSILNKLPHLSNTVLCCIYILCLWKIKDSFNRPWWLSGLERQSNSSPMLKGWGFEPGHSHLFSSWKSNPLEQEPFYAAEFCRVESRNLDFWKYAIEVDFLGGLRVALYSAQVTSVYAWAGLEKGFFQRNLFNWMWIAAA